MTAAMVDASCSAISRSRFVGQMHAPLRQAAREGVVSDIQRMRQVIDAWQHEEPKILRLLTMPPTDMPPKPTP